VSAFAVALLLRPARDRIQDMVDRVYDRRAYNGIQLLGRLGQRVGREVIDPARVRDALRIALHDPELDVLYAARQPPGAEAPTGPALLDGSGAPATPHPARQVTPVQRGGQQIAIITHCGVDELLLAAVIPAAAAPLENARLQAELGAQVAALRASRGRIASAADAERRRIERDLHDGAQQRLVGLAVHIQSTRRGATHSPDVDGLLTFTVEQLQAGVAEIRALVYGILPSALVSGGLPAALAELRDIAVTCDVPERPHPDIEATGWFVVCEAVANARKHAPGAPVTVTLSTQGSQLRVEVHDHGPGGAHPDGEGLRHLADRVDAHGGTLTVHSPTGRGTLVTAVLPCA
jgi:signal transduction histidine kinase